MHASPKDCTLITSSRFITSTLNPLNSISTIHQSYNSSQRLASMPILSSWDGDSHQILRINPLKYHPNISTWYIYIHVCIIYIYIILPPTFQIIAPFNWLKSPISHIVFYLFYHLRSPINSINLEVPTLPATCSNPQKKRLETQSGSSMIFEQLSRFRKRIFTFFFRFLTFLYCSKCLK
jgi:hypothetical protein